MGVRVPGEQGELGFYGGQDARDLRRRPPKVVRREHPEANGRDPDLGAPFQHIVEPVGPERVRLAKIGHPLLEGVATVAVDDDAEMLGNAAAADLSQQAPLVEVIEEATHRQSFTLAPSGLESQETGSSSAAGRKRRYA